MGINVAGFVAGGLLQGVGQGIQRQAEIEREMTLMQYQAQRAVGLKQMEIDARHEDTKTRVEGEIKSSHSRVEAAGVSAGASETNNTNTQNHEDARADKARAMREASARYAGMIVKPDSDDNLQLIDPTGKNPAKPVLDAKGNPVKADTTVKFDPTKAMSETQAMAVAAMNTDLDLPKRAAANKVSPMQQALDEAQVAVTALRSKYNIKTPGLVTKAAPDGAAPDMDTSADAPVATVPPPAPVAAAAPTPAPVNAPAPAPAPLPTAIAPKYPTLPADRTKIVNNTIYQTAKGPATASVDPKGNFTFTPVPGVVTAPGAP